jgi:hypothetical protein
MILQYCHQRQSELHYGIYLYIILESKSNCPIFPEILYIIISTYLPLLQSYTSMPMPWNDPLLLTKPITGLTKRITALTPAYAI